MRPNPTGLPFTRVVIPPPWPLRSSRPEELCGRSTAGPHAGFENGKGTNAAQAAIINAEMPKQEL
jgi:hypothetical protein